MAELYSNSIFFIDVDKIKPNPFQPRREFDQHALNDLAQSIRQYGVLQPLTVSRVEEITSDGGMVFSYELIAGERRLRASKIAGLSQVPVVVRVGDDDRTKLELAIIENLQREDLNPVERARAFFRLSEEFHFSHTDIGKKMGKSREYVSNTLRLLQLPEDILNALSEGKISEGHTRPLMMLTDHRDEQIVLFKEILYKKITVREAERIARRIAVERIRRKEYVPDPELLELEEKLRDALGTRVHIEKKDTGGQITIDFFSKDDLETILDSIHRGNQGVNMLKRYEDTLVQDTHSEISSNDSNPTEQGLPEITENSEENNTALLDDRSKEEVRAEENDDDLYSMKNFSL